MDTSDIENLPEPQLVAEVREGPVLTRDRQIFSLDRLEELMRRFSPAERLLLYIFSIALAWATLVLLIGLNTAISLEIPTRGGSIVEGETGPARFINPILAVSEPDQDLSQLIYSGLMRAQPDGTYLPDLADSYTISSDGTTYTFHIRKNATFHDDTPVTAADVLYTVSLAQNPDVKSPHRADWEGVTESSPDPYTVVFTLPHAYAPFIEDTTLGILPKHLWQSVPSDSFPFSQLNTHPIGSGPYKVAGLHTDATGAPTRYDLVPFGNFVLGGTYVGHISFAFFPNQGALAKAFAMHQVDAVAGISPSDLSTFKRSDTSTVVSPLPRVFGVFFNQNHNAVLADAGVRTALDQAVDKQAIVNTALHGYGEVIDSPIPPGVLGSPAPTTPMTFGKPPRQMITNASSTGSLAAAQATLKNDGWTVASSTGFWTKKVPKSGSSAAGTETLSFKLATADEPELIATANLIAKQWKAAPDISLLSGSLVSVTIPD
jgi:ABC-type transport system substrate-binding protein